MPVVLNETAHRFECTVDDHVARLDFRIEADRLVIAHTEVADELEGRGVGGDLVRAALHYAAEHDLTIVPMCPFARDWLERHPDETARAKIAN